MRPKKIMSIREMNKYFTWHRWDCRSWTSTNSLIIGRDCVDGIKSIIHFSSVSCQGILFLERKVKACYVRREGSKVFERQPSHLPGHCNYLNYKR